MRYQVRMHPTLDILVSSIGEVFVPQSGNNLAHWTFGTKHHVGYRAVQINGKSYEVHRLVAQTFLGPIPKGYQVDHINRCPGDNRVENLRIVTQSENQRNTSKHDRVTERGGTHVYEGRKQYDREHRARYLKTRKCVRFSDGSRHCLPLDDALILMAIPLKQRVYRPG